MKYKLYRVSFQYSEKTFCTNIVKAYSLRDIDHEYSKYFWHDAKEASFFDLEEAERKHIPVINLL
jgi:hypothetical protein